MPNIGPMELIVVLVIALLILGPKKLPEVGRSVGHGIREFKDSITGGNEHNDDEPVVAAVHPASVVEPVAPAEPVAHA